jgi:hypothetical protein
MRSITSLKINEEHNLGKKSMMSLTSVKKKKHNKEPNLCDRPSWEDVPYGKI